MDTLIDYLSESIADAGSATQHLAKAIAELNGDEATGGKNGVASLRQMRLAKGALQQALERLAEAESEI